MIKLASPERRRSPRLVVALAFAVVAITAQAARAQVVMSIPQNYTVTPGGTVNVSVNLSTVGALDILGIQIALQFDDLNPSAVFTLSNVMKGGLLDGTWSLTPNTTNPGYLLAVFNGPGQSLAPGSAGSLLTFDLTLANSPSDPGPYPINLLQSFSGFNTSVEDFGFNEALTTLPTNSPTDAIDGLITVAAIPEPSHYAMAGMLVGLAGLSHFRNRRRGRVAA